MNKIFVAGLIMLLSACGTAGTDIEMPKYQVIGNAIATDHGTIETRQYPKLLVAEVVTEGDRDAAANAAFRKLADFIFGNNQPKEKIAMTAPVIQENSKAGAKIAMTAPVIQEGTDQGRWTLRFVMPSQYDKKSLPKPNNPDIRIYEQAARKVIVIQFSGWTSDSVIENRITALKEYAAANKLKIKGAPVISYYDPPWTLPFMRRNEVAFELLK